MSGFDKIIANAAMNETDKKEAEEALTKLMTQPPNPPIEQYTGGVNKLFASQLKSSASGGGPSPFESAKENSIISSPLKEGGGIPTAIEISENKKELTKRIELMHFLILAYARVNELSVQSTVLTKFKETCQKIFDIKLTDKTDKFIEGVVKMIDDKILSNPEFVIIYTTLFLHAQTILTNDTQMKTLLEKLQDSPKSMYEKYEALRIIYNSKKLISGGKKPRKTRRHRKSRRQNRHRKSKRR